MRTRRTAFDCAVAWALACVAGITAVAPHSHNLAAEFFGPSAAIAQSACLHSSSVAHIDAVQTSHEHPCIACERQHRSGLTAPARTLAAPHPIPERSAMLPAFAPARGPARELSLRGPPGTSSC